FRLAGTIAADAAADNAVNGAAQWQLYRLGAAVAAYLQRASGDFSATFYPRLARAKLGRECRRLWFGHWLAGEFNRAAFSEAAGIVARVSYLVAAGVCRQLIAGLDITVKFAQYQIGFNSRYARHSNSSLLA